MLHSEGVGGRHPQRLHCLAHKCPVWGLDGIRSLYSETLVLRFAFSSFLPLVFPFDLHFKKLVLSKLQMCYGRTKFLKRGFCV